MEYCNFQTSPTDCILWVSITYGIVLGGGPERSLLRGPILAYGDPPILLFFFLSFGLDETICISPSSKGSRDKYYQTNSLLRIHSGSIDQSSVITIVDRHFPRYSTTATTTLLQRWIQPTHTGVYNHQLTQHAFNPPHKSTCCNHCHFRSFDSLYHSLFTLSHLVPVWHCFRRVVTMLT